MTFRLNAALAAVVVASAAVASPADAQLTLVSPDCNTHISVFSPVPNASPQCLGAFAGNNHTQTAAVELAIAAAWGGGFVDLGSSDDAPDWGPFTSNPDDLDLKQGWLTLDSPLSGDFALILKGANQFSIFGFDDVTLTSIYFTMNSVAVNRGLSHATLYQRPSVSVPEPGSMLLMLTGMVGLAAVRRRREGNDA